MLVNLFHFYDCYWNEIQKMYDNDIWPNGMDTWYGKYVIKGNMATKQKKSMNVP